MVGCFLPKIIFFFLKVGKDIYSPKFRLIISVVKKCLLYE